MAKQASRNVGASVRSRLLRLAREKHQSFELLLTRYVNERLLYRLSISAYRDRFVLKGAMLMSNWFDDTHRPTRDVDFLGYGDPTPKSILAVFREVCLIEASDGVTFETHAMHAEPIREEVEYGGLRIRIEAMLDKARVRVIIDIGFGDDVEPGIEDIDLSVLLDQPAPRLRAYARETVIAEKFQAMVALGLSNSRMKDFYDIWLLSKRHQFNDDRLSRAIAATFHRRQTSIPERLSDALTKNFAVDTAKNQHWAAFTRDLSSEMPSLGTIVTDLANFLMPHAQRANHIKRA
jgi:predicted nucleotidyltransferase component of viral defense system